MQAARREIPVTRWYRQRSIGGRLALAVAAILSLMTLGSAVAFWQLRATIAQAERLHQVDRMAEDVLRLHTDVLTLWGQWQDAVSAQQVEPLTRVSASSRNSLADSVDRAIRALSASPADAANHASMIVTLQTLRVVLLDQIDAMVRLAEVNEWSALRRRLDGEVRRSIQVTRSMVEEIDREVENDQREALLNIRRVSTRATGMLATTALLTLVLAGLLATAVTRSITRPLSRLGDAAQALARREFHQVPVTGDDELANLGHAFNEAASRLTHLYDALEQSERHYRLFFEMDLSGNYVSTPEGVLLACNPAFARIFGFDSVDEALRTNMTSLYPDTAARDAFLELLKREKQVELREEVLRKKDGSPLHVIKNAVGVFDPAGELTEIRGYLIDNTERRRTEAALRQAQKLEAVGRLAGGIAHDFNNLLTAIIGYSDAVLDRVPPANPIHGQILQVRKAGDRAAALTRQLLIFSRKHMLQPRIVDLNEIVADMYSLLTRLIGEHITISVRTEAAVARVKADPVQIEQVIMNLAVNARDAMPNGGTLTLATTSVDLRGDEDDSADERPPIRGPHIVLVVADTGCGMDADTKSHLFEPFFTTKPVGKGTGLGLSMVYGIVRESGGHIAVWSEPGQGTTWKIYLPRAEAPEHAVAAVPEVVAPLRGTETVLLAEDEANVRALASSVLRAAGYTVIDAADGEEALQWSRAHRHRPIDVLVTDVVMPQLGGKQLAEQLAAERPAMKVLFISGYLGDPLAGSEVTGREHFLTKPFAPRALLQKVREVLDAAV